MRADGLITCPRCEKLKPDPEFRNGRNRREEVCNKCRQRDRNRASDRRAMEAETDAILQAALHNQEVRFSEDPTVLNVRALDRKLVRIERLIRKSNDRLLEKFDKRTIKALRRHERSYGYLKEMRTMVIRDGLRGQPQPLLAYFDDDEMLIRHGYTITKENPDD